MNLADPPAMFRGGGLTDIAGLLTMLPASAVALLVLEWLRLRRSLTGLNR